jgi:hypothetical protein
MYRRTETTLRAAVGGTLGHDSRLILGLRSLAFGRFDLLVLVRALARGRLAPVLDVLCGIALIVVPALALTSAVPV